MSWAAHEIESFYFTKKFNVRVSFLGVLLGSLAPDFLTKFYVYGFEFGGIHLQASNPAQWHRGWPGMGFTTSFMAGLIFALLIYLVSKRKKAWFWGVLIGYSAHVATDSFDSAGVMMFWPFYNENISVGMWAYGSIEGPLGDAIAYYSSLGFAMDMGWVLIVVLFAWRALSKEFFIKMVRPVDGTWGWMERKFRMPERVQLALYRSFFFYGVCRVFAWTIWVHLVMRSPWDLSWGGPYWVPPFKPW